MSFFSRASSFISKTDGLFARACSKVANNFPNITNLDPIKECQTNIQTVKQILKVVEILLGNNNLSESMKNQDPITAQEIFYETLSKINEKFQIPIFVYQVSGEYSMIKAAVKNKGIN